MTQKLASPKIRRIAQKTVRTFGAIKGRPLSLAISKHGYASTDGYVLRVPPTLEDDHYYLTTEKQLAHVLFETDAVAARQFCDKYSTLASLAAKAGGVDIPGVRIGPAISRALDILECHRVTSLWGRLYPGSYMRLRQMQRQQNAQLTTTAHDSLLDLLAALSLDVEVPPGDLDRYRPYCEEALRKVRGRSFRACLLVTKWLLKHLVNELLRQKADKPSPPPPDAGSMQEEMQALLKDLQGPDDDGDRDSDGDDSDGDDDGDGDGGDGDGDDSAPQDAPSASADMRNTGADNNLWTPPDEAASPGERAACLRHLIAQLSSSSLEEHGWSDVEGSPHAQDWQREQGERKANEAIHTDPRKEEAIASFLDTSKQDMEKILDRARKHLQQAMQTTADGWLTRDITANVELTDVHKSEIARPELSSEDRRAVKRLRQIFQRVQGARAYSRSHAGVEVDIQAYIERRVDPCSTLPVFKRPVSGQGFSALLLVDLSGSMNGDKIKQTTRACELLRRALDYPFVNLRVWGFASGKRGSVRLVRFPTKQGADLRPFVGGTTPLHAAVQMAIRELKKDTDAGHLIVLTDGVPMFQDAQGRSYSPQAMYDVVHDEVASGRRQGISTTGLLIGHRSRWQGNELQHAVSSERMKHMFGSRQFWRYIDPDNLGKDLVKTVSRSFAHYLRAR